MLMTCCWSHLHAVIYVECCGQYLASPRYIIPSLLIPRYFSDIGIPRIPDLHCRPVWLSVRRIEIRWVRFRVPASCVHFQRYTVVGNDNVTQWQCCVRVCVCVCVRLAESDVLHFSDINKKRAVRRHWRDIGLYQWRNAFLLVYI